MVKNKYNDFEKYINDSFKNCWNIPGIAITIFDDKNIKYTFVNGYADLKTKTKLDINDKFCIASCSKSILCATIASLIDKKQIPNIWDITLESIFQNSSGTKSIHTEFKNVTVRQLAMHNSGIDSLLDDVDNSPCIKKYQKIEATLSKIQETEKNKDLVGMKIRKKLADIVLKQKTIYEPGSKFEYSNWGYGILGAILEKYTKKNYKQSIQEEIMKPLNIDADLEYLYYGKGYVNGHYSVWWDSFLKEKNLTDKLIPLKKNQYVNPLGESPAGECWMSILDCAKYCQMYLKILGPNKLPQNEKNIIKPSTIKYLTKKTFEDYGYGWFINKRNHVYHGGSYFHTRTQFHMIPEKNIGIALSCNTNFSPRFIITEFLKTID